MSFCSPLLPVLLLLLPLEELNDEGTPVLSRRRRSPPPVTRLSKVCTHVTTCFTCVRARNTVVGKPVHIDDLGTEASTYCT